MKVADCMSRHVVTIEPDQPIAQAARFMLDDDTGALPVGSSSQVTGIITDRDIAVRAVALGRGPDTPVREVMSDGELVTCFEDQDIDDVAVIMSDRQVRRMPVMSREGELVGIISLADLTRADDSSVAEAALSGASEPGGEHNQSTEQGAG